MTKRRMIPPSRWRLARVAWEADCRLSYADIGRKLTVSRQAVFERARREGWARQRRKIDPLFPHLADAGLGCTLPVYVALGIAEALLAMERAIGRPPVHFDLPACS